VFVQAPLGVVCSWRACAVFVHLLLFVSDLPGTFSCWRWRCWSVVRTPGGSSGYAFCSYCSSVLLCPFILLLFIGDGIYLLPFISLRRFDGTYYVVLPSCSLFGATSYDLPLLIRCHWFPFFDPSIVRADLCFITLCHCSCFLWYCRLFDCSVFVSFRCLNCCSCSVIVGTLLPILLLLLLFITGERCIHGGHSLIVRFPFCSSPIFDLEWATVNAVILRAVGEWNTFGAVAYTSGGVAFGNSCCSAILMIIVRTTFCREQLNRCSSFDIVAVRVPVSAIPHSFVVVAE